MTTILDLARSLLSEEGVRTFSERALWFAGESQKPTAIPALVLVGSGSLLVLLAWMALVAWFARHVAPLVWRWLASW